MNRSHNAKTNECPDYTAIHSLIYLLAVQLHGILSTLFFFFMHYFRRQLLFSWTSSSVATFSHTAAYKSILAFHSSSLPNHSLSTLCETAVMSSDFFTERHLFRLSTCLTHFLLPEIPAPISGTKVPDLIFAHFCIFPISIAAFYSYSCADSSHKTTRNRKAQHLLNGQ